VGELLVLPVVLGVVLVMLLLLLLLLLVLVCSIGRAQRKASQGLAWRSSAAVSLMVQ